MKLKLVGISIIVLFLCITCTKTETVTMSAVSIEFLHEDGSLIEPGECIDMTTNNYVLKIEVRRDFHGFSEFEPVTVEYSLNGISKSLNFTEEGSQEVPVVFVDGLNQATIVGSQLTASTYYVDQGDFVLVE